jgi:hypothetical protein
MATRGMMACQILQRMTKLVLWTRKSRRLSDAHVLHKAQMGWTVDCQKSEAARPPCEIKVVTTPGRGPMATLLLNILRPKYLEPVLRSGLTPAPTPTVQGVAQLPPDATASTMQYLPAFHSQEVVVIFLPVAAMGRFALVGRSRRIKLGTLGRTA